MAHMGLRLGSGPLTGRSSAPSLPSGLPAAPALQAPAPIHGCSSAYRQPWTWPSSRSHVAAPASALSTKGPAVPVPPSLGASALKLQPRQGAQPQQQQQPKEGHQELDAQRKREELEAQLRLSAAAATSSASAAGASAAFASASSTSSASSAAGMGPSGSLPAASSAAAGGVAGWWAGMPANDKLVFAATLALMLSNMGKVDMSVAIVPMSAEMGWSASVSGLVQALFYTGYMLACIPGGYLASSTGGRLVLPVALATWSAATFVAPLAAATVPTLSLTRFIVGAGQGVAPSAVVDIVARTVPVSGRASATTTSFGGLHLGTVVGLLAAPPIVNGLGWQALFYIYGGLGLVWYAWFESMVMPDLAAQDPTMTAALTGTASGAGPRSAAEAAADKVAAAAAKPAAAKSVVPYRAFLRAKEMQALMVTHFCNNMYYFTLLSWLPTYFVKDLDMDLSQASFMSMVPAMTGFVVSNLAGRFADWLLAGGMPLPTVRKTVQSISMLGSAAAMVGALAADDPAWVVGYMIAGLTAHPFTLAGLFCTPNDLSSRYAGALLGISNTCGALGAVTGIAACGLLLDATGGSWEAGLYYPLIGVLLAGIYAYVAHCNNNPIDFDARDNSRFEWEDRLRAGLKGLGLPISG
ncbi:hypothetical protein HYH02_003754 [Chlamydomonas schloesseri]|uniref:Major facilitator superfamily (MFS) profile domain-containing protein n=1 Tax=Chlamydomonas schloesseri TaxID=2026947 RepID=A0A835WRF6_9CHLO|nr:hypothetical protein HYH02_003754 [Chlamydomonas schloesseri]|eukprot:KAG2451983.1 hypothetical protein HYH02_003754 [Chlamydomonas schloesseri]